jgi:hypothetical protein
LILLVVQPEDPDARFVVIVLAGASQPLVLLFSLSRH